MAGEPFIRTAAEADIPALTEIYAHYVLRDTATFEIEPPDPAEMNRRRLSIVSQQLPYLVVEIGGRLAGYAYAARYRPRLAYRFTVEDSVYIHPDLRGQGMGHSLLAKLIELCSQAGCRQMIAVIGDSANHASIRLHEKLGFRKIGVLEETGRKFGRWIDTVLMQRALHSDRKLSDLREILEKDLPRLEKLQQLAACIRESGNHRWVGLYQVNHSLREVRNLVFAGPGAPAYPNFTISQGITGVAIKNKQSVNVGDVTADPNYLTAFGSTKSEIIVPIFDNQRNTVIGTIDIESGNLDAFTDREQVFLEDCAELLGPLVAEHF